MTKIVKIAIDAGHGLGTSGKQTPNGEKEWSFNNKVVLAAIAKLNTYENVQILRLDDPTGKTDIALKTRTDKANNWKADVLVSCHHNALAGKWGSHGGVETFVHPTGRRASYDIAEIINPLVVKAMGLRNRGVKKDNLHMVRESNMAAILVEGGFMDSTTDISALRSDAKLKAQGEAIAIGLAQYFKLKPKITTTSTPKIDTTKGIGMVKINTNGLALRKGPGPSFIMERQLKTNETYYAYSKNGMWYDLGGGLWASEGAEKNHLTFTPHPKIDVKPEPIPIKITNPIMGKSQSTLEQMVSFVEKNNANAKNLREIALSFLEVGEKYGIRGDVAYCQSIIETGWFKFDNGTAVTPDQYNYCGMGVIQKGMKGNSFKTVKDGVTAQIQHLMAYANKNNLPVGEVLLDPRFNLVTRGIAPNWEDLSNKWAMNANYGNQILSIYNDLLKHPIPKIDLDEIFKWGRNNAYAQNIMIELWKKGGN